MPTIVQLKDAALNWNAQLTRTLVFDVNTTAGNWVVVLLAHAHNSKTFTIEDNGSNTWSNLLTTNPTTYSNTPTKMYGWITKTVTPFTTITLTCQSTGSNVNTLYYACELSGLDSTTPKHSDDVDAGLGTLRENALSPDRTGIIFDIVQSAAANANLGITGTPSSVRIGTANNNTGGAYRLVTSPGAYAPSWTIGTANREAQLISVALQDALAGGAQTFPQVIVVE